MTIAFFIALALIYFGYMMYLGIKRQKLLSNFEKSLERAETLSNETQQRLQSVFERLEQIRPDDLQREYFFEKNISGRPRMFSAPVRYIPERQVLVISADDAINYDQEIAFAFQSNIQDSGLADILFTRSVNTTLPIDNNISTIRRFSHDDTEST